MKNKRTGKQRALAPVLLAAFLLGWAASCSIMFSPEVVECSPAYEQMVTDTNFTVRLRFSKPMNRETVEKAFYFTSERDSGTTIKGTFSWTGDTELTFTPFRDLLKFPAVFLINLGRNAKDLDENVLARDFVSRFSLYSYTDIPRVIWSYPVSAETNFSIQSCVTLAFSHPMDDKSLRAAFSIDPFVSGNVTVVSNLLVFEPLSSFDNGKIYDLTVKNTAAATNGGTLLEDFKLYFLAGQNFTIPSILGIYTNLSAGELTNGQTGLDKTLPDLTYVFPVAMDPLSLQDHYNISPSVETHWTFDGSNAVLHFDSQLVPSTNYVITISKDAKSVYGAVLPQDHNFRFRTDGPFSTLPSLSGISESGTNDWQETNINWLSTSSGTADIRVDFSACTNMRLASLYTGIRIEYLYGNGDPSKTGKIRNIFRITGKRYLLDISNIDISNYYKLVFNNGSGGIEDEKRNPMDRPVEIFFTSTN